MTRTFPALTGQWARRLWSRRTVWHLGDLVLLDTPATYALRVFVRTVPVRSLPCIPAGKTRFRTPRYRVAFAGTATATATTCVAPVGISIERRALGGQAVTLFPKRRLWHARRSRDLPDLVATEQVAASPLPTGTRILFQRLQAMFDQEACGGFILNPSAVGPALIAGRSTCTWHDHA